MNGILKIGFDIGFMVGRGLDIYLYHTYVVRSTERKLSQHESPETHHFRYFAHDLCQSVQKGSTGLPGASKKQMHSLRVYADWTIHLQGQKMCHTNTQSLISHVSMTNVAAEMT